MHSMRYVGTLPPQIYAALYIHLLLKWGCQDKPIFFGNCSSSQQHWVCSSPSCLTWPWNKVSNPSSQALTLASVSSTGNHIPSSVKWENSYSSAGMWWWIKYLLPAKGSSISLGKYPKPLWMIMCLPTVLLLCKLATTEKLRASENTGQRPQYSEGVQSQLRIFFIWIFWWEYTLAFFFLKRQQTNLVLNTFSIFTNRTAPNASRPQAIM